MSDARPSRPPRPPSRRDAPLWRQAIEGIGLVVVLSLVVGLGGLVLSLLVSLLF